MKKNIIIMGILSTVFGMFSCATQSENYERVDAVTFAKAIEDKSVVRLDVRTADEYSDGHIDGAINIDVLSGGFESKAVAAIPAGKTVALYCRSGNRSRMAAKILSAKGYKVIELNSGYTGWMRLQR